MTQRIKAILFDLDDTLLQTSKVRYALVKKVGMEELGMEIDDAMITAHWGKPFHLFVHDLFGVDDVETFIPNYLKYRSEFPSKAYEDAVQVISALVDSYPLGIVSAASKELILGDLAPHGFPLEKFFHIQSSEDTTAHKPDPAVFEGILSRLLNEKLIAREDVLYVGDALSDYHAAHGAGMQFIGIADRTTPKQTFDDINAQTISELSELLHIVL